MRTKFKQLCRKVCRGAKDESAIGERGRMAEYIASHAENGQVALHVWQMDCDCASWDSFRKYPASVRIIAREIDDIYYGAEGSVRIQIIKPSEIPEPEEQPRPRDYALEAFEDGHPYSIHLGDTA